MGEHIMVDSAGVLTAERPVRSANSPVCEASCKEGTSAHGQETIGKLIS